MARTRQASFSWLVVCFICSGASGLIYEVAWVRSLELVFGSTTFAVATVLAAFMGGLALGSYAMGRWVVRLRKYHPLAVYAVVECLIAVVALCVPLLLEAFVPVYQHVWRTFHASFFAFSLIRFLLSVALLLVPTFLMGATLPLVSEFVGRDAVMGQRRIGLLYACNTLGAVLGCAGAGIILFPALGLAQTQWVAVGLNLAAAGGGMLLARQTRSGLTTTPEAEGHQPAETDPSPGSEQTGSSGAGWVGKAAWMFVGIYACSGFVAMLYEVAWSRVLVLALGCSTYAYTIMLATFLLGLAGGAWLAARFLGRTTPPLLAIGLGQTLIALTTYLSVHLVEEMPFLYLKTFELLSPSPRGLLSVQFILAFGLMILPTLGLGAMFPLTLRGLNPSGENTARVVGWAYALNTVGAILGSVLAGFWLVPRWGSQATLLCGVTINAGIALLAVLTAGRGLVVRYRVSLAGALGVFGLGALLGTPAWDPAILSAGVFRYAHQFAGMTREAFRETVRTISGEILMFKEGLTCTITIFRTTDNLCLQVNGKPDASTPSDLPNPFGTNGLVPLRDLPTQTLAGQLPMLFAKQPDTALIVGLGSGVTLHSVLTHPVREVECIELEDAVVRGARFFSAFNHRPLEDPRTRLIVNDARNHLLVADRTYDVIISEPSNPWIPGAANLFTKEFFELVKERLKPDGVFGQWVQLYELEHPHFETILRTITSSFKHVHVFRVQYDALLVASEQPLPMSHDAWQPRLIPSVRADLARINIRQVEDVLAHYWIGEKELVDALQPGPLNTDDNMLIEFAAPLQILAGQASRSGPTPILAEAFLGRSTALLQHLTLPAGSNPVDYWAQLSSAALDMDHLIEAELYARHALQGAPPHPPNDKVLFGATTYVRPTPARLQHPLAARVYSEVLTRTRRQDQARSLLHDLIRQSPDAPELLVALAKFHATIGEWAEVRDHAQRLVALNPDHPMGRYHLGRSLHYLNQAAEGWTALEPLIPLVPNLKEFKDLPFYLGALAWRSQRYEQAAQYYEIYLKRDPSHLQARTQFADALYHLNRTTEALAQWQRMGQISSAQSLARFQQAQNDWRLGRVDSALTQLEEARHLDPWNQEVVLMLAQVRKLRGDTSASIQLLENYLSWNPDRTTATGYLSQLHARQNNLERAGLLEARFRSLTGHAVSE